MQYNTCCCLCAPATTEGMLDDLQSCASGSGQQHLVRSCHLLVHNIYDGLVQLHVDYRQIFADLTVYILPN